MSLLYILINQSLTLRTIILQNVYASIFTFKVKTKGQLKDLSFCYELQATLDIIPGTLVHFPILKFNP